MVLTTNALSKFNRNTGMFNPSWFFSELDVILNPRNSYPPYNIRKENDKLWVVEVAVAGFDKSELKVEVDGDKLMISGAKSGAEGGYQDSEMGVGTPSPNTQSDDPYYYRGIASRAFKREFDLAPNTVVGQVSLENGMLYVNLHYNKPENKVKKIPIVG